MSLEVRSGFKLPILPTNTKKKPKGRLTTNDFTNYRGMTGRLGASEEAGHVIKPELSGESPLTRSSKHMRNRLPSIIIEQPSLEQDDDSGSVLVQVQLV